MTVAVDFGRVREAPSPASPVLFRVLEGDVVQVLQSENDWVHILHSSGWQGWAHKSLFAGAAGQPDGPAEAAAPSGEAPAAAEAPTEAAVRELPAVSERTATVAVLRGRVRGGPSLDAPVLFLIERGRQVGVLGESGRWWKVAADGRVGWAHKSLFAERKEAAGSNREEAPAPSAATDAGRSEGVLERVRTVGVEVGLVRASPSWEAPVRFRLYRAETPVEIERQGEWIRIRRVNGWVGWAHESLFSTPEAVPGGEADRWPAAAERIATVDVDVGLVREAPSTAAPLVFRVVRNLQVAVIERQEDWLRVRLQNGWTGWAHRSLFAEE